MLDVRNLYVARDKKTGLLCLFEKKPKKEFGIWMPQDGDSLNKCIDPSLFPEVTDEDKKPTRVELVIKKE